MAVVQLGALAGAESASGERLVGEGAAADGGSLSRARASSCSIVFGLARIGFDCLPGPRHLLVILVACKHVLLCFMCLCCQPCAVMMRARCAGAWIMSRLRRLRPLRMTQGGCWRRPCLCDLGTGSHFHSAGRVSQSDQSCLT
eukprot:16446336-Heterocapsa_arctica.AAC.1